MRDVVLLPGIIAPASARYAPLLEQLHDARAIPTDLFVYSGDRPPAGYSIEMEIAAVDRAADAAGFDRFHLYGHSGGGAISLAYAAARPHRLLSLAVDEPAADFTEEDRADPGWAEFDRAAALPEPESTKEFLRLQLAPDQEVPQPPGGPPPPWMAKRPAGIRAFLAAIPGHHVEPDRYRAFEAPVYYSLGTGSHPRWAQMKDRLSKLFPDFTSELYQGRHHLNTSHQAEPARVADALEKLWGRAEA